MGKFVYGLTCHMEARRKKTVHAAFWSKHGRKRPKIAIARNRAFISNKFVNRDWPPLEAGVSLQRRRNLNFSFLRLE